MQTGAILPISFEKLPVTLRRDTRSGSRHIASILAECISRKQPAFEGHNLQRCKAQFGLLKKLEMHYTTLENTVNRIAKGYTSRAVAATENISVL